MPHPGPLEAFYRCKVFGPFPGSGCPMEPVELPTGPRRRQRGVRRSLGERLVSRAQRAEQNAFHVYMLYLRNRTSGVRQEEIAQHGRAEALRRHDARLAKKRKNLDELARGLHIVRRAMLAILNNVIDEEDVAAGVVGGEKAASIAPLAGRSSSARPQGRAAPDLEVGGVGGGSSRGPAASQEVAHGAI